MEAQQIVELVKEIFGQDPYSTSRLYQVMQAKQAACYLLHKHMQMNASGISKFLHIDRTTASDRIVNATTYLKTHKYFKSRIEKIEWYLLVGTEFEITEPRHVFTAVSAMFQRINSTQAKLATTYLLREKLSLSVGEQSYYLGLDHNTIANRLNRAEDLLQTNSSFRSKVERAQSLILS
jgi:chromosomal replication initiation ATPase DnaA